MRCCASVRHDGQPGVVEVGQQRATGRVLRPLRKWLADKYGAENIIVASVHRDETSPHMTAFVTPITKDGRLSAKEFIGNKAQMQADQTTFAAAVRIWGCNVASRAARPATRPSGRSMRRWSIHRPTPPSRHRQLNPRCCERGCSQRTLRRRTLWPNGSQKRFGRGMNQPSEPPQERVRWLQGEGVPRYRPNPARPPEAV